jgi:hypothetical protein
VFSFGAKLAKKCLSDLMLHSSCGYVGFVWLETHLRKSFACIFFNAQILKELFGHIDTAISPVCGFFDPYWFRTYWVLFNLYTKIYFSQQTALCNTCTIKFSKHKIS